MERSSEWTEEFDETTETAGDPGATAAGASSVSPAEEAREAALEQVAAMADEIVRVQRAIHRSPEPSWEEFETTQKIDDRLRGAGLEPQRFEPTGLFVDLGSPEPTLTVGLRADIDALHLQERTGLAWASRNHGVSHACGHDVHTASLLGAVMALNRQSAALTDMGVRVRCFFQPAEESSPSGGLMVRETGALEDVDVVFALHCDPTTDAGRVGLRVGSITANCDRIAVTLTGDGGHTSRPHLTQDVTFALAKVVTDLPAVLTRLVDSRASLVVAWGSVQAGEAENVIPDRGVATGTVRMTDAALWQSLPGKVRLAVGQIVAPYGVHAEVEYVQGVPAVVNSALGIDIAAAAVEAAFGPGATTEAEQSMGGEDFAWLLHGNEGALLRLGTRTPGGHTYDLHRGDLQVDPRSAVLGAQLFAALPFAAYQHRQERRGR